MIFALPAAIPAPAPVIATIKPSLICELFPFLPKCDKDDDDEDDDDDEPPTVPVPGPLPVIGAGSAFLWSRKLRQRIKEAGK